MAKSPAFQFYAKDWLSSSKIALMPPEYEGAYIRLLAYCWDSGDCSLPDDDDQLAMLSRLGEGWFKGGSTVVRKCFIPHPSKQGFLSNKRLLDEVEKQLEWRKKSSKGGKASAAKRAEKQKEFKGGSRVVEDCLQPNANTASASASSFKVSNITPIIPLPDWLPESAWQDFCKHRGKKFTDKAKKLSIKKLYELREEGNDPVDVINQTIANDWKGLFPVKGGNSEKTKRDTARSWKSAADELRQKYELEAQREEQAANHGAAQSDMRIAKDIRENT